MCCGRGQGCQIFLGATYQKNKEKYFNTQTTKYSKWTLNMYFLSKISTPSPSKHYPNWYFWYETIPSGNPGRLRVTTTNPEEEEEEEEKI
jgi:hypothetical protein